MCMFKNHTVFSVIGFSVIGRFMGMCMFKNHTVFSVIELFSVIGRSNGHVHV